MAQSSKFLAPLEGLRAVAALGIIGTHAAFDTALSTAPSQRVTPFLGPLLSRFDYFVAVFFVLSGFLLWRRHTQDASYRPYYLSRVVRIVPAYVVFAAAVLLAYPDAVGIRAGEALATLTLTQLYIPDGLLPGMSHIWSLCVEVAFYLLMPFCALALRPVRRRRARIAAMVAVALLSYGWAWLPFVQATPDNGWANLQIFPISYASWFAAGMIAAELGSSPWFQVQADGGGDGSLRFQALHQLLDARWLWWLIALFTAWVAGQEWYGPLGLEHPSPFDFNLRIAAGTVFGIAVVWPYALRPRPGILSSPPFQALGRWSYGMFLWHLPIMGLLLPVLGLNLFSGSIRDTVILWIATVVVTIPVAAASFMFVEEPCRFAVRRRRQRQQHQPSERSDVPAVDVTNIRPR